LVSVGVFTTVVTSRTFPPSLVLTLRPLFFGRLNSLERCIGGKRELGPPCFFFPCRPVAFSVFFPSKFFSLEKDCHDRILRVGLPPGTPSVPVSAPPSPFFSPNPRTSAPTPALAFSPFRNCPSPSCPLPPQGVVSTPKFPTALTVSTDVLRGRLCFSSFHPSRASFFLRPDLDAFL